MKRLITLARRVFTCAMAALWLGSHLAFAGPFLGTGPHVPVGTTPGRTLAAVSHCTGPCCCPPNAKCFGYFPTGWRLWPCETRRDTTFPESLGRETIPTPPGQEQLPPPKPIQIPTERLPPTDTTPEVPGTVPPSTLPPGGVFPPDVTVPGLPGGPNAESPPEPTLPGITPKAPAEPSPPEPGEPKPLLPGAEKPSALPSADESLPQALPPDVTPPDAKPPTTTPPSKLPLSASPPSTLLPSSPPATKVSPAANISSQSHPVEPSSAMTPAGASLESPPQPDKSPQEPLDEETTLPQLTSPLAHAGKGHEASPATENSPAAEDQSKLIQADWTAALHPGLRPDAGRPIPAHGLLEPARPASHQTAIDIQPRQALRTAAPQTHVAAPKDASPPPPTAAPAAVALDGFCPVELVNNERWAQGDARWTVVHQGRTYMFSGRVQRQQFLADPQRYVPAFSGHDAVFLVKQKRQVLGKTDYCVTYQGRLYMFSTMAHLAEFQKNPQQFVRAVSP